jgi:hypothetical protein
VTELFRHLAKCLCQLAGLPDGLTEWLGGLAERFCRLAKQLCQLAEQLDGLAE